MARSDSELKKPLAKKIDAKELLRKRGIEPPPEGVSAIALEEEKRKKELEEVAKQLGKKPLPKEKKKEPKVDEFGIKDEELQPVALPAWPDATRRVPSALIRCAIFAAIRPGRRRMIKSEVMTVIENVEIVGKGEQLDQEDFNVWMQLAHEARGKKSAVLSTYRLLKLLKLPDSGKNRQTLMTRLTRLQDYKITFQTRDERGRLASYSANLIAGLGYAEGSGALVIDFNPRIARMMHSDGFTLLDWEVRQALEGHQLAQWLHAFYSSHATQIPMKVSTLHKLCGSSAVDMKSFTQSLKRALEVLEAAFKERKLSFNFKINDGLVTVQKTPSVAQKRYLKAKEAEAKKAGYKTKI